MKKLIAPPLTLVLTALLAACDGGPIPPAIFSLTVNLTGPAQAPVKITNTTSKATVFNGTLESGKTFAGIVASSVLTIESQNVFGYTAPAPQTLTLDSNKTVTLAYSKPQATTYSLTVTLDGVSSTPVKIVNTTTRATLFEGNLSGSKTFDGIVTGNALTVQPGPVDGHTTPAVQTLTLNADQNVTLRYSAVASPGTLVSDTAVSGKIMGTELQIDNAGLSISRDPFSGQFKVLNNVLEVNLSTLVPDPVSLAQEFGSSNCAGNKSDPLARSLSNYGFTAHSAQGDQLGFIEEQVVGGPDAVRPSAIIYRLYADRIFSFKGECAYQNQVGDPVIENYDINLVHGWNTLVASRSGNTTTVRNAAPGNRVELRFTAFEPGVGVYLDPNHLTFADNETVTVNARLTQTGNYTGTVSFSTNFPGLTVER